MRKVLLMATLALVSLTTTFATPLMTARDTGAEPVLFIDNVAFSAARRIVGGNVDLGSALASTRRVDARGAEIYWKVYRDVDAGPMRHVFYQQMLRRDGIEAQLVGGYLSLHFRKGEGLTSLMGTQFTTAQVTNAPRLTPAAATLRARAQMAARSDFRAEPPFTAAIAATRPRAALLLISDGSGELFRYAYTTIVNDASGNPFEVDVDADTAAVIHFNQANPDVCIHPATVPVGATGAAVRSEGGTRSLQANNLSPGPGYPYEGIWSTTLYPDAIVLQDTTDANFMCDTSAANGHGYTVFPVLGGGYPAAYTDSGAFNGRIATDALFFTHETFQALRSVNQYFPTYAFENTPIVIQSVLSANNATYNNSPMDTPLVPRNCVYVGVNTVFPFPLTSSMDVVAHEWGHGTIFKTAGWPYNGGVGSQLHEGFSDAIGHIVEKARQPGGLGVERSGDWDIAEDSIPGGYLRSGTNNDGDAGHTIPSGQIVNNWWHKDEPNNTSTDPHDVGNMINVAMRMVADGGYNNACDVHPQLAGCASTTTGIGITKASRIFLDMVIFYGYPSEDWINLADQACVAARDEYSSGSPNCATYEQDQIIRAFRAIGYPPAYAPFGC